MEQFFLRFFLWKNDTLVVFDNEKRAFVFLTPDESCCYKMILLREKKMIKYVFGISLGLLVVSFGGCSSSKRKPASFQGLVAKKPSFNKGKFWGKRLVTFLRSPGILFDSSSLGKNCGLKTGLPGIKECLALGAAINFKSDGGITALTAAVLNEDLPVVEFLLKAGADPNSEDDEGQTPLMHASRMGHFEIVERLVLSGASLGQSRVGKYKGMRALDMAEFYLNKKVAYYLRLKMGWPSVDRQD